MYISIFLFTFGGRHRYGCSRVSTLELSFTILLDTLEVLEGGLWREGGTNLTFLGLGWLGFEGWKKALSGFLLCPLSVRATLFPGALALKSHFRPSYISNWKTRWSVLSSQWQRLEWVRMPTNL